MGLWEASAHLLSLGWRSSHSEGRDPAGGLRIFAVFVLEFCAFSFAAPRLCAHLWPGLWCGERGPRRVMRPGPPRPPAVEECGAGGLVSGPRYTPLLGSSRTSTARASSAAP
jgi:hypothetical protein